MEVRVRDFCRANEPQFAEPPLTEVVSKITLARELSVYSNLEMLQSTDYCSSQTTDTRRQEFVSLSLTRMSRGRSPSKIG